jgi:hypothetical protein
MATPAEPTNESTLLRLLRMFGLGDRIDKDYAKKNARRGFVTATTPAAEVALDTLTQKKKKGSTVDVTGGGVSGNPTLSMWNRLWSV